MKRIVMLITALAAGLMSHTGLMGQTAGVRPWASNVVVPQCSYVGARSPLAIQVTAVDARVSILEQAATTTIEISLKNQTALQQVAELLVPVPDGAVVRSFTFQGSASEPAAELLSKDAARRAFDSIVAKLRDPGLMEFAGSNLVRTSVFPVAAGGEQKVQLTYEQLLPAEGERIDYTLPRSGSIAYQVPWTVSVQIKSKRGIGAVYSPTHALVTESRGKKSAAVKLAELAQREPGAFRLSYLIDQGDVTASLFTYPNRLGDGGYFLLLGGISSEPQAGAAGPPRRELTLVLDRSGSMNGEKIVQAQQAAIQIVEGLEPGEFFNIITYNDTVERFADVPVAKDRITVANAREFITGVTARGGTNIHDALVEALRPEPSAGCLPIVLFLTDGRPTVGQTSEKAIRELAELGNSYERRIFSFGVGVDVNTPLLDKISRSTRAFATFVLPQEDVEVKVGRVFRGLDGPVMVAPAIVAATKDGGPRSRIYDVLPTELPDMFEGDQLIVIGRYRGKKPLDFVLTGAYRGRERSFGFRFKVDKPSTQNAFVARLWASRKIGMLSDAIRDLGATTQVAGVENAHLKELTDEIVRISTEFGILTEYTAFLAQEGTDLTNSSEVLHQAVSNYATRAVNTRSGWASVNQELNNSLQRNQACLNPTNCFLDTNMQRVQITTVQQVNDVAFYRRNGRWVDSRLISDSTRHEPGRTVAFGSPDYLDLLWRLARRNEQNMISLDGDILIEIDGETVLIKAPKTEPKQ